ncbi:hypothetical protein LZG04_15670 [Saccharothrix sp. S26]|uniref:hypothetical protein n=1 Tax=Saccharothrix sp. S26 TaxID=2907215 RepID=UPI001F46EA91|nr:hypothetical protein [Saccharothrix sp. S26]MCE6996224.1 hypothetical protein [Saccharothrix sp. S26]
MDRLERDHPGLTETLPAGTMADQLVMTGRVLPVLDGFDEIAPRKRPQALAELNAITMPLLLTSRVDEYAAAIETSNVLFAATAVELADLTVDELADYLPRTMGRRAGGQLWEPVLTEVRENPRGAVATALTTPLMVSLARTIYSDTPDRDPAELLDTDRFSTPEAIENHLLGALIPAAYRKGVGWNPNWDAERAQRWFGFLARRMDRLGTRDLAWWQLGSSIGRISRALVIWVAGGLVFIAAGGAVGWMGAAPVNGLLFAVAAALVLGLAHVVEGAAVAPFHLRLRLPRTGWRRPRTLVSRFTIGLVLGVAYWIAGAERDPVVGLGAAALGGVVLVLMAGLEVPTDVGSAPHPRTVLGINREAVLLEGLALGLMFGLVVGFARGLWSGLVLGLAGALGFVLTAWGHWVVARTWLPLTRRLPWAVISFLNDAHERGILRRTGASYQFRHARLQHHLSGRVRGHDDEPAVPLSVLERVPQSRSTADLRPRELLRGLGAGPRVPVVIGLVGPAVAVMLSLVTARSFASAWGFAVSSTGALVAVVVALTAGQLLVQWATLWLTPAAVDPSRLERMAAHAREVARRREQRWEAEHRPPSTVSEQTQWDRPDEWDDRPGHHHYAGRRPRRGLLIGSSAIEAATGAAHTCGVVVDALWPRLARVVPDRVRRHVTWLDRGIAFFRVVSASAVASTAVLAASRSFALATIPALLFLLVVFAVRPQVGEVYAARADATDMYRLDLVRALRLPAPRTHDGLIAMGDRLMGAPVPDGPVESWELMDDQGRPPRGFRPEEMEEITERLGELVASESRRALDHLYLRLAADRDLAPKIELAEHDAQRLVQDVTDRTASMLDARLSREFRELRVQLGEELTKVMENALAGPELVNFAGYLVVELGAGGGVASTGTGVVVARPGSSLELTVSVVADDASWDAAPDRLTTSDAFLALETVQVEGGRTEPEVAFEAIVDSATMNPHPHRVPMRVAQPQGERQETITLRLPDNEDRHEVWLQLFQSGRLVQAVAITVDTRAESG